MNARSGWFRGPWLVALMVSTLVVPESSASGGKGGRGGRAPRQAAPRRQNFAPNRSNNRMAHPAPQVSRANPARTNNGRSQSKVAQASPNSNRSQGPRAPITTTSASTTPLTPNTYTYGTGRSSRTYHAYGYGKGSRNRSHGGRSNRSQNDTRALVSRLRSVHQGLSQLDHDYRGHRVTAMHSISNAIRQLSHRSTSSSSARSSRLVANGNPAQPRNVARNNNGARPVVRLTQAQSDSRMSQALRTTQGIQMQMSASQGTTRSSGRQQARTHVARATRELHTALTLR